ncbi:hypothetical protein CMALT394_500006 [Carnobacterium maltaromaticum]|nr:hypothetical protein CMALT394_500006 [Carnobacterium maltaromaticum]
MYLKENNLILLKPLAATTIQGIEVVNALYKKNRRKMSLFDFSIGDEIGYLLEIALNGAKFQSCIDFFIFQKDFTTQPFKLSSYKSNFCNPVEICAYPIFKSIFSFFSYLLYHNFN